VYTINCVISKFAVNELEINFHFPRFSEKVTHVSRETVLPVQDTYSVSDLVSCLGYTRQSVSKAIRKVCPNADKTSKGYRLTADEAMAVASCFSIDASFENKETVKETQEKKEADNSFNGLLVEQLKAKDKQIELLSEQLKTMSEQNLALIKTVNELTTATKTLAANATMHTAKEIQQDNSEEPLGIVPQKQSSSFLDKLRSLFS